ncbi:hypothetical protein GM51_8900 [freshwater metagenome]|jgi:hypothetical protein|uniref:Uncharacterized protein n=1 Tax=freshwater metagenome TaxID=449393 RepID=A0A094Q258_9ZZZZ
MPKPVTIDPAVATLRGRLGGYRSRAQDDPELLATKAALAEARLDSAIERIVASASPLTQAQKLKLKTLLDNEGVK